MPPGLSIKSKDAKTVFVTKHAWERFIERRSKRVNSKSPTVIANMLQESFAEATPTVLEKRYVVARIISNDFNLAEYYLNSRLYLRFVVCTKDDRKILTTVERVN